MKQRARAIIIQNNKLITLKRVKENETYWVFPGGGAEDGEDLYQTLEREMKEELGVEIQVGDLFFVHHFKTEHQDDEEFFYFCTIIGGELGTGFGPEYQPDSHYEGKHIIEEISLENIAKLDLRPQVVKDKLLAARHFLSELFIDKKTNL